MLLHLKADVLASVPDEQHGDRSAKSFRRGRRRERVGVVVSDKAEKTVIIAVETLEPHPKYKKRVKRSKRFMVHEERNAARVGDTVRITETRPLSKRKRWRLTEILSRAK